MKKTLLFIFLFSVAFTLQSQIINEHQEPGMHVFVNQSGLPEWIFVDSDGNSHINIPSPKHNSSKDIFQFKEKLDSTRVVALNSNGNNSLTKHFYNFMGKIFQQVHYTESTSASPIDAETNYYYDAAGNLDSIVNYAYQPYPTWYSRKVYRYFYSGLQPDSMVTTSVNTSSPGTTTGHAYSWQYTSTGDISEYIRHSLKQSSYWEPAEKIKYTYNTQNILIADTSFYYNSGNWAVSKLTTYTYNANGQVTEILYRLPDVTSGFVPDDRDQYYYNSSSKLAQIIHQYYDFDFDLGYMAWINLVSELFNYDNSGNLTENIYQYWILHGQYMWDPYCRYTISYNPTLVSETWLPPKYGNQESKWFVVCQPDNAIMSERYQSPWDDREQWSYFYSTRISVQEITNDDVVSVFPNPATENLFIRLKNPDTKIRKIEVIASGGNIIISEEIHVKEEIVTTDISKLGLGFYILRITFSSGQTGNYRLLKQ